MGSLVITYLTGFTMGFIMITVGMVVTLIPSLISIGLNALGIVLLCISLLLYVLLC